jgi:F0F1-type ATP synthase assembly protein I
MNLMKLKLYKIGLLDRAFWPSFALVAVLFTLVVIFGSLIIGKPGQSTITISIGSLCVFLCFFVAVLYFVIAFQVFRYTENRTGSSDIKVIAIKIILSGICFILIVCFSINQLASRGRIFLVHTAGAFIMDLLYSIRSFLQIDVFGTIKKKNQEIVVMDDKNVSTNTPTLPNTS